MCTSKESHQQLWGEHHSSSQKGSLNLPMTLWLHRFTQLCPPLGVQYAQSSEMELLYNDSGLT